jgi:transcriptional regulator with XRE-family HTH domain
MEDLTLNEFKALLSKKIRMRRKQLNLTQSDLAEKLGNKDKQTVNRYELDGANPTIFNFIKLADALELTLDELLDFSDSDDFKKSN